MYLRARQHTFYVAMIFSRVCGVPQGGEHAQVRLNLDRWDSGALEKKQTVLGDQAPSECTLSEPQPLRTPPLPYNFMPK